MKFKQIPIGQLVKTRADECDISIERLSNYLNISADKIENLYLSSDINVGTLLSLSKILSYDFFRIYSQHLILYSPPEKVENLLSPVKTSTILPTFRKNIYTREIVEFILEQVLSGKMTKKEVIEVYKIPKTTLYKWLTKYN